MSVISKVPHSMSLQRLKLMQLIPLAIIFTRTGGFQQSVRLSSVGSLTGSRIPMHRRSAGAEVEVPRSHENSTNHMVAKLKQDQNRVFDFSIQKSSGNVLASASATLTASTTEDPKALWLARGMLVVVSAFYGTNFGCVKILDDALDPSFAALARFIPAALVFLPYVFKVFKTNRKLVLGGFECGAYNALGYWSQAISLETTSASTAAFICALAVVVVPFLDMMFPKKSTTSAIDVVASQRTKGTTIDVNVLNIPVVTATDTTSTPHDFLNIISKFLPALLAAVGVGCLELGGSVVPGIGDLWAIGQPLFFGLGIWRAADIMHASKGPGETQAFTGSVMLVVALCSLLWTAETFIGPHFGDWAAISTALQAQVTFLNNWEIFFAVFWAGIVTTALTALGENMAMHTLSAAESTVIFSTEPLWGTAFAAMALGEQVGWNTVVGAVFILSACMWSTYGPVLIPLVAAQAAFISEEFAITEGFEELLENISINWVEILERLGGGTRL